MEEVSTTRPEKKKENQVQKLLDHLRLEFPEGDLLDVLYSKRYRKQVFDIFERMMSHDYVDDEPCDVVSSNNQISGELILMADNLKRLREYEDKYGISWHHSICYPLDPNSISDMPHLQGKWAIQRDKLEGVVLSGRGKAKRVDVASLDSTDVASLLSPTLVTRTAELIVLQPDTFKSKYVLVCCINAPVLFGSDGCQSLLNLCKELSLERDDCEMVMVARMNILTDTKEVFDHLFSGFPPSCLAVPYEDWERRERIWKLLNCGTDEIRCLVYDTDGLFLTSFFADGCENPYGAEAFPFTEEMLKKIDTERKQLRNDSLEKLLRPYGYSPDVVVHEVNGPQKKSISEVIKNKHVGLYVCCEGYTLRPLLNKLYKKCKENEQEFEIVVLYLPLLSNIDPLIFKEKIDNLLQKRKTRGWWCLPFNNSVSLRFWGLTSNYDIGDLRFGEKWEDKLIIVGPDGKILDMYGGEMIKRVNVVYPFTRDAIVKKKMEEVIREVSLESSLIGLGRLFRGNNTSDTISADELLRRKKKIIIYMGTPDDYVANGVRYDFKGLVSQYEEMKKTEKEGGAEFEVVFIEYPLEGEAPEKDASKFCAMPWYIHLPCAGTHAPLAVKLKRLVAGQSLVGFGEDGHICSVKLLQKFYIESRRCRRKSDAGLCLGNTLRQDICQLLHFDEYCDI